MSSQSKELAIDCQRQYENCLWTATTFTEWLRILRAFRLVFTILPLILGSLASWNLLTSSPSQAARITALVSAFLAGLLPSIYRAMKLDDDLALCQQLAGEFTNLRDEFRRAALISSKKPFKDFEIETRALLDRQAKARAYTFTAPEFCFRLARKKIEAGHYDFAIDFEGIEQADGSNEDRGSEP